jgi:hypothetical protein
MLIGFTVNRGRIKASKSLRFSRPGRAQWNAGRNHVAVRYVPGSPPHLLSKVEVEEKARELIEAVLGMHAADQPITLCDALDDAPSTGSLFELMRFEGRIARN